MGSSQFQIFGQVVIDTRDAEGNVQRVTSALGDMGATGGAGVTKAGDDAQKAFGKIQSAQSQALDASRLLSNELGIGLPRQITKFLASSEAIGPALSVAFNASLVLGMGAAIVAVIPKLDAWLDHLRGIEEVSADVFKQIGKANEALGGFGKENGVGAMNAQIRAVGDQIFGVQQRLEALQHIPQGNPYAGAFSPAMWMINRKEIGLLEDQLKNLTAEQQQLGVAIPVAETAKQNKNIETLEEASKRAAAATAKWTKEQEGLRIQFAGSAMDSVKRMAEVEAKNEEWKQLSLAADNAVAASGLAAGAKYSNAWLKAHEDVAKGISELDKQTEQAHAQSLSGREKIEYEAAQGIVKINRESQELIAEDAAQGGARRADIERSTAQAIAEVQAEEVRKYADQIDEFINRVFVQAKSFSDVLRQFLMQMVSSVVKAFSHMAAQAILGVQNAGAGASGSLLGAIFGGGSSNGGGGFGSILGSMFGLNPGSTTGAGGSALGYGSGMSSSLLSGGGLSAGLSSMFSDSASALGAVGTSASGGASSGVLGSLAFSPGKFFSSGAGLGMAAMGGIAAGGSLMASAASSGGPIKGALGGALMGAGIDAALFYEFAAMTGPIGWAVAGVSTLVGLLLGFLGQGKAKTKAANTEQTYEFAADTLFSQFKSYQVDYDTALQGMEELIQQGVAAEAATGTGKWAQKGSENLTSVINAEIKALNDLQQQRVNNATVQGAMTIPEFPGGGMMQGFSRSDGHQLAWILPGEYIMRRSAVQSLGPDFLAALNRTPAYPAGGMVGSSIVTPARTVTNHITMHLHPQRGMSDREAANIVVRGFRLAQYDGAL
jgi:hypothetical protein